MRYGVFKGDYPILNQCVCGSNPLMNWRYIRGTANRINYFVACPVCKLKTRPRKDTWGASDDWNNEKYLLTPPEEE